MYNRIKKIKSLFWHQERWVYSCILIMYLIILFLINYLSLPNTVYNSVSSIITALASASLLGLILSNWQSYSQTIKLSKKRKLYFSEFYSITQDLVSTVIYLFDLINNDKHKFEKNKEFYFSFDGATQLNKLSNFELLSHQQIIDKLDEIVEELSPKYFTWISKGIANDNDKKVFDFIFQLIAQHSQFLMKKIIEMYDKRVYLSDEDYVCLEKINQLKEDMYVMVLLNKSQKGNKPIIIKKLRDIYIWISKDLDTFKGFKPRYNLRF